MTSNRDPDRLIHAWLDLMPDEAPDRTLAAVHQAVEAAPQVRRPLIPAMRRFFPMNRVTYAAAAAIIVALVAGGALLLRPASNIGGPARPSPTLVLPPSIGPSSAPVLAPESLRSTWIAPGGSAGASGVPSFLRLVISAAGDKVSIFDGAAETFKGAPIAGSATEFAMVSTDAAGGCQVGDVGRYGFAFGTDGSVPGSDGTVLALTAISDACAARATALARGWAHAIDAASNGGRGISTAFTPMFMITMPGASYGSDRGMDSVTLTSSNPDRTFIAVRNPAGWTDPCSSNRTKLPVALTIKAFTAYLKTLPGFTVQSTAFQVGGHPAARLVIPTVSTADCPGGSVYEWSAAADTGSGSWRLNQGETDVLYLVEVEGNLILVQWLGPDVTAAEEQALLATVQFTDALPGS